MGHPRLSVGESIMLIHAQRTVIYGVVIVSRNLERTNENDGFKMAALENLYVQMLCLINYCVNTGVVNQSMTERQ